MRFFVALAFSCVSLAVVAGEDLFGFGQLPSINVLPEELPEDADIFSKLGWKMIDSLQQSPLR